MATATEERETPSTPTIDDYDHWVWRLVRGTVWGTVDLVKMIPNEIRYHGGIWYTRAEMAAKRYRANRRFGADESPDPDEIPGRKWSTVRYTCVQCRRSWKTAAAINAHFKAVHQWEREPDPENRAGTPVFGRRPHGKRKAKGARPRTAAVDKRTAWTRIGQRAMENGLAAKLKAAWSDIAKSRPRKLSQIKEDLLALEQVYGSVANESINAYRRHLIRLGFDPADVQNLTRAAAAAEDMARYFSSTIAVIEENLAEDIAAAKARASGTKPDDSVLIN